MIPYSPAVAVLTPVYRHAEYLGPMLDSLRAQTFTYWECAVVLDGPDEEAERVARLYAAKDRRIAVTVLPEHRGLPAARNAAAKATTARWLLPFDADDLMEPLLLESLTRIGEMHLTRGTVVFTPARCLHSDGSTHIHRYPTFSPARFADECQITGAALRRRQLWEELGGWDESWTDGAEDWHFYARALAKGALAPIQLADPLWTYRQHDGARNSRLGMRKWSSLQPKIRDAMVAL